MNLNGIAMRVAATCVVALGLTGTVSASQLYGTNFDNPGTLFSVNQATGALSTIGATGTVLGDLTSNPSAGTVWGVNITGNQLYTLNVGTGAATAGPVITGTNPAGGPAFPIVSIAYDPLTSALYGNTSVPFGGTTADTLYKIDPLTGAATFVGGIQYDSVFALGFRNGVLYGISDVANADGRQPFISISTTNAAATLIAGLPTGSYFDLAARPEDGTTFVANTGDSSLYTIDTGTGALTLVGAYGVPQNVVGLAFVGEIPEPSTYVLMIAGLLGLGWIARRRTC